ncbi:MAG: S8 family serine peptidase [bacterium]|nr:S8 family serine peptidase [bacterium]
MRVRMRLFIISLCSVFVIVGAGCDSVGSASSPLTDSGSVAEESTFEFPDDADPAMASLPFVDDELLVRAAPGAAAADLTVAFTEADATVERALPGLELVVLRVEPGSLFSVASRLADSPLLEAVQKSYLYEAEQIPDDPEFAAQDHLERIGLPDAWEITTGSPDVLVAVLDTGVAGDHPDLIDKLLPGWNAYDDNDDTEDVLGHGTSVAGTLAADTDNGEGVAGISWHSPIVPVRISNARGQASSRTIAAGIVWAVDRGARVVNVSFAPLAADRTVLRAARYARSAGALVFISAGNDGLKAKARANNDAVFVGAIDSGNSRAGFSSYGAFIDVVTPGVAIQTTTTTGFGRVSGTSFSSPIAAGVAALIWSMRPELRPVTVQEILADTAVDLGESGRDDSFGAGLIDAAAAVAAARDIVEREDTRAPTVRITRPRDGDVVSRVITVRATATDDEEVADVVLSVDGVAFATDTAKPFRFSMNTGKLSRGLHTLSCVATDEAGNASRPASIQVVVGRSTSSGGAGPTDTIDPVVTINFPVDGAVVSGRAGIQATTTDNVGLAKADWLVDGVVVESARLSGTRSVLNLVWDASRSASGDHLVAVRVTDSAGNRGVASVNLTKP